MSFPVPETPQLTPVFSVNVKAEEGIQQYVNDHESLTVVKVTGGSTTTIDPRFPFDTTIQFGFDDLTSTPTSSIVHLDCKIYLRTPNGSGAYMTYYGVVEMGQKVADVLTKKSSTMEFDDGYVTCNPVVKLDSKAEEEYKWILKANLLGKGRFIRDESGQLFVQYVVYKL